MLSSPRTATLYQPPVPVPSRTPLCPLTSNFLHCRILWFSDPILWSKCMSVVTILGTKASLGMQSVISTECLGLLSYQANMNLIIWYFFQWTDTKFLSFIFWLSSLYELISTGHSDFRLTKTLLSPPCLTKESTKQIQIYKHEKNTKTITKEIQGTCKMTA